MSLPLTALVLATFLGSSAPVEEPQPPPRRSFAFELSPVAPLAGIWPVRVTWTAWRFGEVTFGYAYQHERMGDIAIADGHTLLLGYRQYFWRGLNAELELWPAWDRPLSLVDGKTYPGFNLFGEVRLGYRWDFFTAEGLDLYVLPQACFGYALWAQNPAPGFADKNALVVLPMVWIGIRI